MISMQGASVLTLYAILIVAVVQDITSMRISNRLIIMGLFLSMAFGIVLGGMPRIIQVLLNISIPVIMLYLFYLIGVLGAGDIKLFSVIGGFTNLKILTDCVLAAFVAGAVIAVLKMLYMRNLRISLFKAQVFLRELFSGKFSSYRNGWVQEQNLMHFSVAVLLGMLYAHRTVWLSLEKKGGAMRRARLGLCIGDREYGDRFTSCLMNHYRDQLELHMFSQKEALQENWKTLDAIVLSDDLAGENRIECEIPQIYLFDGNENVDKEVEKGVVFVDKYQEVNKIVDEILKQIGEEIKNASGGVKQKLQVLAVYSLAENEMQLPFAVTLSSILSENEKVLLLDLQENSGLSQLMGEFYSSGMEELLVMAESGKYSKSRMVSCIGHLDRTDVVYPLGNTECLCEVKNLTYQKLFQILAQEMNYTTIVLNLGSRFMGFFELLGSCQKIFLMKSRGGLGQWREKEFLTEIQKRGEERLSENLREIQLPLVATPVVSCERLVEQWKWNEFGDSIRRMMPVG